MNQLVAYGKSQPDPLRIDVLFGIDFAEHLEQFLLVFFLDSDSRVLHREQNSHRFLLPQRIDSFLFAPSLIIALE